MTNIESMRPGDSDYLPNLSFLHPSLGNLTGVRRNDHVVQFRTIPYARIPARFRQSVLIDNLEPYERSCTEYGPACPQNVAGLEVFGGPLPGEKIVTVDELRCLNLTVTVPTKILEHHSSTKAPVMVHVHGGGFTEGSHTQAVRDMFRMVNLSVQENLPVIIVSIHYRVNWLGFLACQDLVDEATTLGEPPSNFGLYDQRTAFQWVKKHISGFGGNAGDITAFGESAGSVSLSMHICSNVPLFQRAILQSGTTSTGTPIDLSAKEDQYIKLLKFCGINKEDPKRLEKLREVAVEKLIEAIRGVGILAFAPLADKSFFPVAPTYFNEAEIFESCDWVTDIIIGDSLYEGYLFSEALRNIEPMALVSYLERNLGPENTRKILSKCSITKDMDRNLFWTRLNMLVGDLTFSELTHNLITTLAASPGGKNKKLYRYNATLRNPFPGTIFYGVAGHHFIELAFQFMTLLERYPNRKLQNISIEFARRLISFANGHAPWQEFEPHDQAIAIVSSCDGWKTFSRTEDEELSLHSVEGGRRYATWEAIHDVYTSQGERGKEIFHLLNVAEIIKVGDKYRN